MDIRKVETDNINKKGLIVSDTYKDIELKCSRNYQQELVSGLPMLKDNFQIDPN